MLALIAMTLLAAGDVPLCPTLPQARRFWPKQVLYAVYDQKGRRCWLNQPIELLPEPEIKLRPLPLPENWG